MTEAEWLACSDPEIMLSFLRVGSGRAKLRRHLSRPACERKLRLFIVACCRRIWPLISDPRSRQAVEKSEQFADGLTDEAMLNTAHQEAVATYTALRTTEKVVDYCAACPPVEASRVFGRGGAVFYACVYAAEVASMASACIGTNDEGIPQYDSKIIADEKEYQADLIRDIFGNPFHPLAIDSAWRSGTVVGLARTIYRECKYDRMADLADALASAGCDQQALLAHCHQDALHVRGCWLVDQILN